MWIKRIWWVPAFIVAVMFIASLPGWIRIAKGNVRTSIDAPPVPRGEAVRQLTKETVEYVKGIWSGESFIYQKRLFSQKEAKIVHEHRNYIEDAGPMFLFSATHLMVTGSLAVFFGVMTGLLLARSGGVVREVLEFLVTVPDFALAFFLQLLMVFIYKRTGVLPGEVFTTESDTAVLLPLITLFLLPFVYTVRQSSAQAYQVLTEDYILLAKAKGLGKTWIWLQHVARNVLPVIEADLVRLSAILTGNLIVIEYLFNSPGVTRFFFHSQVVETYGTMLNHLWMLILLFLITFLTMWGTLGAMKRGMAHD
ncbi:ABC transporter permease subunit [Staphylospora marina]|uniref:ABC transporter permease subunit n=1 Tax=Staphylospora marina TaxID=2490858 RepID=UPI000F5BB3AC|nr:ABC transporter permease subunit [Staphylospora marina]